MPGTIESMESFLIILFQEILPDLLSSIAQSINCSGNRIISQFFLLEDTITFTSIRNFCSQFIFVIKNKIQINLKITHTLKIEGPLPEEHAIDDHLVHGELQQGSIFEFDEVEGWGPAFHAVQTHSHFGLDCAVDAIPSADEQVTTDGRMVGHLLQEYRAAVDEALIGLSKHRIERLVHADDQDSSRNLKQHSSLNLLLWRPFHYLLQKDTGKGEIPSNTLQMRFLLKNNNGEGYIQNIFPLDDVGANLRDHMLENFLLYIYLFLVRAQDAAVLVNAPLLEERVQSQQSVCGGFWLQNVGFVEESFIGFGVLGGEFATAGQHVFVLQPWAIVLVLILVLVFHLDILHFPDRPKFLSLPLPGLPLTLTNLNQAQQELYSLILILLLLLNNPHNLQPSAPIPMIPQLEAQKINKLLINKIVNAFKNQSLFIFLGVLFEDGQKFVDFVIEVIFKVNYADVCGECFEDLELDQVLAAGASQDGQFLCQLGQGQFVGFLDFYTVFVLVFADADFCIGILFRQVHFLKLVPIVLQLPHNLLPNLKILIKHFLIQYGTSLRNLIITHNLPIPFLIPIPIFVLIFLSGQPEYLLRIDLDHADKNMVIDLLEEN